MKRLFFLLAFLLPLSVYGQTTPAQMEGRKPAQIPLHGHLYVQDTTGTGTDQNFGPRIDSLYQGVLGTFQPMFQQQTLVCCTPTWDVTSGGVAVITTTAATTITVSGEQDGGRYKLRVTDDGLGSGAWGVTIDGATVPTTQGGTTEVWIESSSGSNKIFSEAQTLVPSQLDVTNAATTGQTLTKASGDQFTWADGGGSTDTMLFFVEIPGTLTTGTAKATRRLPQGMKLTEIMAYVATAPTGAALEVDVNDDGTSMLSTVLSIDAGEYTTETAAASYALSDSLLGRADSLTIDIDQVGSTVAGADLGLWFKYRPNYTGDACDDTQPTLSVTPDGIFKPDGFYQDAGKLTAADDVGESIYTWDNVGSGTDLIQATVGDRPVVADAVANGHDGADFVSSDFLAFSPVTFTHTEHNSGTAFWVCTVFEVDNLSSTHFLWWTGDADVNAYYLDLHVETTGYVRAIDRVASAQNAESNNTVTAGTTTWACAKWNGEDDRSIRIQGDTWVQDLTANSDHTNAWDGGIAVGSRQNSSPLYLDGKILEIWWDESPLSGADETLLTDYFECKFDL